MVYVAGSPKQKKCSITLNSFSIFSMLLPHVKAKYLTKKTQAGSVEAIRLLDELLVQLVVSISQSSYVISVPVGFDCI